MPDVPDEATRKWREDQARTRGLLRIESWTIVLGMRKRYSVGLFLLLCGWMVGVLGILVLQGFGRLGSWPFNLSDGVLIAALGTTTANVIGLFIIVARYVFPRPTAPPPR